MFNCIEWAAKSCGNIFVESDITQMHKNPVDFIKDYKLWETVQLWCVEHPHTEIEKNNKYTHTHIYIYIYIYICSSVSLCKSPTWLRYKSVDSLPIVFNRMHYVTNPI